VALLGERGRFAPFGVAGGGPAALNRFVWDGDGGPQEAPMASKITGVKLAAGQKLRIETPGGGGWGDAHQRHPNAVASDVRNEFISLATAASVYRAVVSADGELDEAATARLRAASPA
jgi:N-methylhydantoinase B